MWKQCAAARRYSVMVWCSTLIDDCYASTSCCRSSSSSQLRSADQVTIYVTAVTLSAAAVTMFRAAA
jgi:hypothetical protein